jgi:hypothetical protein
MDKTNPRLIRFPQNPNPHVATLHHLTGANLRRLAVFRNAIDAHLPARDQDFAVAAAVRHANQLEQIAKLDELTTQREIGIRHAGS